ncbi:S-adenosyl-L-methionine-dependent methyltransferase [Exophiala viscosa]|uniref:S-adenosyl-L-methionine-dependent methyltransferase n=1 Tax=Exophiala viscosa TaxID=2486360 RepID=A0AAN6ICH8_9EURO|nr:S-adenosyl-L-methionine-dependent methyltransferase [Exophiala viscosa]
MSHPSTNAFAIEAITHYTPRASQYDAGRGGWHATLGRDFTTWLPPPPGGAILDLACGTGLVTLPYAEGVGPNGVVIGIDVTEGMLDEARRKSIPNDAARPEWIQADITDLSSISTVSQVKSERGGFDIISCCSALVLLENPASAIKHWASFLIPGGKMIIDVPTEDRTLQYLFTMPLRKALGQAYNHDRDWVKDIHTLEHLYEDAGLEVESSFRTKSYTPEQVFGAEEAMAVFEEYSTTMYKWMRGNPELLERARQVWPHLWKESLDEQGRFREGHTLYVTIGRKKD